MAKAKPPLSLPERLKALRERLGLTQAEAAARVGVSRRAWIKWEKEGRKPSGPVAKLLEQFLLHPEEFS